MRKIEKARESEREMKERDLVPRIEIKGTMYRRERKRERRERGKKRGEREEE